MLQGYVGFPLEKSIHHHSITVGEYVVITFAANQSANLSHELVEFDEPKLADLKNTSQIGSFPQVRGKILKNETTT